MVAFNCTQTRDFVVNLKSHHSQCEINYFLFTNLIPGARHDRSQWEYFLPASSRKTSRVVIKRIDVARYTTTLEITQLDSEREFCAKPRLIVRLYHDVEMAEVVAWDNHRHWDPVYSYPNRKMYHRDEKLALNRFLGEWLVHCRKLGLSPKDFVNPLP